MVRTEMSKMATRQWSDDDRDTSNLSHTPYCNKQTDEPVVSVCDIMKEYYQELREQTLSCYERREVSKRPVVQVRPPPPPTLQSTRIVSTNEEPDEDEEQEEVNDDIMEKQIYRKCWYS